MASTNGEGPVKNTPVKKAPVKKVVAKKTQATQPVKNQAGKSNQAQSQRTYGVPNYGETEQQQYGPYRVSRRAYTEAKDAAQQYHKEMMAHGEGPLVGNARRLAILENLEPYMGDWVGLGETKFPGLTEAYEPLPTALGNARSSRGGGGGGGGYTPPAPPIPEMKIRTTSGIRRSPYWQSDDPYNQAFEPRFVVLGNDNGWG
jgi:hypothetical protein